MVWSVASKAVCSPSMLSKKDSGAKWCVPKRYDGFSRPLPDIFHSKPVSCFGFAQELKAMLKRSKKERVLCSMIYIFSFLVLGVSFELPMPIQSNRMQKIVKDGINKYVCRLDKNEFDIIFNMFTNPS